MPYVSVSVTLTSQSKPTCVFDGENPDMPWLRITDEDCTVAVFATEAVKDQLRQIVRWWDMEDEAAALPPSATTAGAPCS